jgi:predicted CopG family antitoxin
MNPRKRALERLKVVEQSVSDVLIIHYSCEGFADKPDGYSPRISSIAIKNFKSAQTYSYSIHKMAEIENVPRGEIENYYDQLERKMLIEFFDFVEKHKSHIFVHWNMRNATYGFQAIYHRYRVLDGVPTIIDEGRLIDLAQTLKDIFGPNYIDNPKMQSLIELNDITKRDFLTGAEEADAFSKKEYFRLHLSTLRKVDSFADILERLLQGKLKTRERLFITRIKEMHEHWLFQLTELVLAVIGLATTIYGIYSLFWP